MRINRNETTQTLPGIGDVHFEPLQRAGEYWRINHNRTHSQRFRFEVNGREYWGEIIRTFDKREPQGRRVSVDVELRTRLRDSMDSRAIPESHKAEWRGELRRAFKAHLEAFLDAQTPEDCARRHATESTAPEAGSEKPFRAYLRTPVCSTASDFADIESARHYIRAQLARLSCRVRSGGAPAEAESIDPNGTYIVWREAGETKAETLADSPWDYRPDPARPFGGFWTSANPELDPRFIGRDFAGEKEAAEITARVNSFGYRGFRVECDRPGVFWVQPASNGAILATGKTALEAVERFATSAAFLLRAARKETTGPVNPDPAAVTEYRFRGDGCQAPGAVVLRHLPSNEVTPYVVHFRNDQDSAREGRPVYYYGDYCATLAEAYEAFAEKVRRYDPDGSRHVAA